MRSARKKNIIRNLRSAKVHKKTRLASSRPRLSVYRTNKYISVQLIDDEKKKTLCFASSRELKEKGTKTNLANKVGKMIAEKAKKENIQDVMFDRGKYAYHGRVKSLAEGAREAGLNF
ncbi:MAG: 50S ribosomal protein L18 [Nanoarchaeota archaeon]|nr:50S ribosomal protein L18 [Nanoarchaeota archaeon]